MWVGFKETIGGRQRRAKLEPAPGCVNVNKTDVVGFKENDRGGATRTVMGIANRTWVARLCSMLNTTGVGWPAGKWLGAFGEIVVGVSWCRVVRSMSNTTDVVPCQTQPVWVGFKEN